MNDITKVQPVYSAIDYWKRWRPYAHTALYRYTSDPDTHGDLDYRLWMFFKRASKLFDKNRNILAYIRKTIKMICRRVFTRSKGKYLKATEEIITDNPFQYNKKERSIDITVDDYLLKRKINQYINRLPVRYQTVTKMYFGLEPFNRMNSVEISEYFNCTPARILHIKDKSLKLLRQMITNTNKSIGEFIYGKEEN